LFFSIDPGYRGTDGKVKTQYQNMITDDDVFYDGFFVPENVYIIGTMNDIDRSVESMDFAMRRRFCFVEVKAGDTADEMFNKKIPEWAGEAKKCMIRLNKEIWDEEKKTGISGLNSSYHIGGAYFLKLKNHGGDFNQLWKCHLEPLLKEYLRGTGNEDKIAVLEKAFFKTDKSDNQETVLAENDTDKTEA
jgi:5-methylcytosine-specific restriction endonuclease McrBC GTP-binding regulatory subunit McrB